MKDCQQLSAQIREFLTVMDQSVTVRRHYSPKEHEDDIEGSQGKGGQMAEVRSITRHQRRAWRRQRLAAAREARRAALQAGLDFRVSGESGALIVHTHSLSWHRAKNPNITTPPPGRGWDGSGPVRMVVVDETNSLK